MKEDIGFMERISRDLEARKAACKILEVAEDASQGQLKSAYRRAATKYHPDHNQGNPEAGQKFLLVKCAYELLASDKPCDRLLNEINSWEGAADDEKYNLNNPWGHFLWWREKFFG
ncbi:MAG: DnaJ domain-containing protein [Sedimentisphaerales bacterium]|nr:DnaJ domain-containing protein [Sedimentisphaerales bacterium]